jgi:hypothetical protein
MNVCTYTTYLGKLFVAICIRLCVCMYDCVCACVRARVCVCGNLGYDKEHFYILVRKSIKFM